MQSKNFDLEILSLDHAQIRLDYYFSNKEHLEIWHPTTPKGFYTLEYQQYKGLSIELSKRWNEQSSRHSRGVLEQIENVEQIESFYKEVSLFDLAKYFKEAMDRMPVIKSYELKREAISLDYKKEHILQCFDGDGILSFKRLLSNCENKIEMIITFLALLDLIRLSKVTVYQNKLFDKIEIHQLEKN